MNIEVKLVKMLDFLKIKLKDGMIREFLRESSMLVRKFYCIGIVSDFCRKMTLEMGRTFNY